MRKRIFAGLAVLALTFNSGCATIATQESIDQSHMDESGKGLAKVATFPVTAAVDVAMSPIYLLVGGGVATYFLAHGLK